MFEANISIQKVASDDDQDRYQVFINGSAASGLLTLEEAKGLAERLKHLCRSLTTQHKLLELIELIDDWLDQSESEDEQINRSSRDRQKGG